MTTEEIFLAAKKALIDEVRRSASADLPPMRAQCTAWSILSRAHLAACYPFAHRSIRMTLPSSIPEETL